MRVMYSSLGRGCLWLLQHIAYSLCGGYHLFTGGCFVWVHHRARRFWSWTIYVIANDCHLLWLASGSVLDTVVRCVWEWTIREAIMVVFVCTPCEYGCGTSCELDWLFCVGWVSNSSRELWWCGQTMYAAAHRTRDHIYLCRRLCRASLVTTKCWRVPVAVLW